MVFAISTKQFHGKYYSPMRVLADKSLVGELPLPPEPDPIMQNIQKDTTVGDLGEEKAQLYGSGFVVRGGKSQPKNNKLRKFVSLNLK